MLIVSVEIRETGNKTHPIGLFSNQFIACGEVIWIFDTRFDIEVDVEDLDGLDDIPRKYLLKKCFLSEDGSYIINCSMQEQVMKRSRRSGNIQMDREFLKGDWYAMRDIEPGEELILSL
jgi:hypothetical protein